MSCKNSGGHPSGEALTRAGVHVSLVRGVIVMVAIAALSSCAGTPCPAQMVTFPPSSANADLPGAAEPPSNREPLQRLATSVEALGCEPPGLNYEAERLTRSDALSFGQTTWIKAGLIAALDALDALEPEQQHHACWTSAARQAVLSIDGRDLLGFQRTAIQDGVAPAGCSRKEIAYKVPTWRHQDCTARRTSLEMLRMAPSLEVFVSDALWLHEYSVRLGGARFNARMTVIKLRSGEILVHSPCAFDDSLTAEVAALGRVVAIIAPGNLHWLHVRSCQQAFPEAVTYICPGVDKRAKGLTFEFVLGDEAPPLWADELSQIALEGTRLMREVAFFHHASRTLILVDLVENFTPATPGTNLFLRIVFRALGMWNRPSPAPEYRFAWGDRARARQGLTRVLAWDFERVILSHGDIITCNAKENVAQAWRKILR